MKKQQKSTPEKPEKSKRYPFENRLNFVSKNDKTCQNMKKVSKNVLKIIKNRPKNSKNCTFSELFVLKNQTSLDTESTQNWPKVTKSNQNLQKVTQKSPKWGPKITKNHQNSLTWPKNHRKSRNFTDFTVLIFMK